MTTRYFIETNFDSAQLARQERDKLAQKLMEQGLPCRSLTLLRATDGIRVFALESIEPESAVEPTPSKPRRRSPARHDHFKAAKVEIR
ncbi:MAG: hypothetical protein AAFN08_04725 [Cyanobacteria bacterium J06559_3]